ncbi:hypothetical protein HBI70_064180 [Parastagonospora nodorum]|nr:hypothetical protein HBH50_147370 [Parastagonospora nodorum]KAH4089380.1 hypothetical protein HBH48_112470 [Parastagonospora nodorum]KAH4109161.1 hypothetical protein HBH46_036380 [Parastagonospora nodorum]KAH4212452.1 hypothetical protein HBI95_037590 [Parastagonospora nodorum]KAH4858820.1 hypothetical protein HBH75_051900 [Parastagonospora nodorum]
MLRLRPSEITLTPEDVEEAFRRIASRRSLKNARHVSPQQGRPVLRRGPQRAVQDTITTLGDIPILRPRPQRATDSSFDDQTAEHSERTTPSPRARADSVRGPLSPSELELELEERTPAPIESPAPSSLRILQLPFRLGRGHKNSPTQSSTAEHRTHGDISSPSHAASQSAVTPTNSVNSAEPDQRTSPTRPVSTTSQAELRGGGQTPPPFPSDDNDRESPHHTSDPESTSDPENPTLHLKSHLKKRRRGEDGPSFGIHSDRSLAPQTEPRRPSERMPTHMRSFSSGTAPTYGLPGQIQTQSAAAFDAVASFDTTPPQDDVFGSPIDPRIGSHFAFPPQDSGDHQNDPLVTGSRQVNSEASTASGAYSFYELPPISRDGSGNQSGSHESTIPPNDGSAASPQVSHGAYYYVRASHVKWSNSAEQLPRHALVAGQHSVSPLPSLPYYRQNTHSTSPAPSERNVTASTRSTSQESVGQPPIVWYTRLPDQRPIWWGRQPIPSGYQAAPPGSGFINLPLRGYIGDLDAATAAIQGRPSPLGPYSEYYQHHLGQQTAQPPMVAQQVAPYPIDQYSAGLRHSATDTAHGSTNHSQYPSVLNQDGAPIGRNAHTARANQRSSESASVRSPVQSSIPSHNSQVQRHREAFEAMHNWNPSDSLQPGPSRLSLAQPTVPRNNSRESLAPGWNRHTTLNVPWNRRTPQSSSSPVAPPNRSPSAPLDPALPAYRPSASPDLPPTIPSRNGPNMRGGAAPDRPQTRARRRVTPARSPNHLRPPRASLPLHYAVSLRSPLLHGANPPRPVRRVPPQQRDQENSGAGEEQLMRQEAAAMHARYGEDVQRDVMDETPPRVGRVERRMFS